MREFLEVICENTGEKRRVKPGLSLAEIARELGVALPHPILGAMVNNELKELDFEVYSPKTLRFIDITHADGMRMYQRSLFFVLQRAAGDVVPGAKLRIEHSVSKGFYCELDGLAEPIELPLVFRLADRMRELIAADLPFRRDKETTPDAIRIFRAHGHLEKAALLEGRPTLYTSVYHLNGMADYFFGCLVPSTGYLRQFDLVKYYQGMLLMVPKRANPGELEDIVIQNKMFDIFQEYRHWVEILGVSNIAAINRQVAGGQASELIKVSEALHEKKVGQVADLIHARTPGVKLVLISGPSSSGKTTFAMRLAIHLKVAGLRPYTLSLDNYFVNREQTPRDERGEYDFETIGALDIDLFNRNLVALLAGQEVELPKFSFETGQRQFNGTRMRIDPNGIIIVEGIHALNPDLTHLIGPEHKFKVYISALTSLSIDGTSRIPTTDNRLIRRIIRDHRYRGYSARDTISRWESVRRGEDKYIFPYQEQADVMFNSALAYEFGILKGYAEPVLREVPVTTHEYSEARRLLKFLSYFAPMPDNEIPPTSILREFLGGSTFAY